jgi:hypothetical protein
MDICTTITGATSFISSPYLRTASKYLMTSCMFNPTLPRARRPMLTGAIRGYLSHRQSRVALMTMIHFARRPLT